MDFYLDLVRRVDIYIKNNGVAKSPNRAPPQTEREFYAGQYSIAHLLLRKNPALFIFEGPVCDAVLDDKTVHHSVIEGLREGVIDLPCDPCCFGVAHSKAPKNKVIFLVTKFEKKFTVVSFTTDGTNQPPHPGPTLHCDPSTGRLEVLQLPYLPTQDDGRRPEAVHADHVYHAFMRCLALLNTRDIVLEATAFPRAERRRREREGEQALSPYHVVKIPHVFRTHDASSGGTHASPRLHLRRGHVRTLETGKKIWIKPFMVGDAARGVVDKHYVVE
jgi:hypothetical protein